MSAPNVRLVEGRKFMWDGRVYDSRDDALAARTGYEHDGFDTDVCEQDGKHFVYTRRIVRQVVTDQPQ